ncbi:MAG: FecR domain-containing protein [Archangium sp.]|nr:FecR domain-containing protein [Archangium sp.]
MSGESPFDPARRSLGNGPSDGRRSLQRVRLLRGQPRPSARKVAVPLGLGALALAGALGFVLLRPAAVLVRDGAGPIEPGTLLVADGPRELAFSDGSQVLLQGGSAARLEAVDPDRVELVLERGHLEAHVMKGTGRTWRYRAGPWAVRVVGTRLSIDWRPERAAVEVSVTEGAVEVSGPRGATVLVRAGESLQRSLQASAAPQPEAPTLVGEPQAAPDDLRREAPRGPRRDPAPAPPPVPEAREARASWKELLARGLRAQALEEANAQGVFAASLEDADALTLADAARLERRSDLAQLLLARVVERAGPDAPEAAFLLGRLELDAHRVEVAQDLFHRSVELAPEGPFAEQARGRLLELLLDKRDLPAAREMAREYLEHHPGGAWAQLALRLEAGGSR